MGSGKSCLCYGLPTCLTWCWLCSPHLASEVHPLQAGWVLHQQARRTARRRGRQRLWLLRLPHMPRRPLQQNSRTNCWGSNSLEWHRSCLCF